MKKKTLNKKRAFDDNVKKRMYLLNYDRIAFGLCG